MIALKSRDSENTRDIEEKCSKTCHIWTRAYTLEHGPYRPSLIAHLHWEMQIPALIPITIPFLSLVVGIGIWIWFHKLWTGLCILQCSHLICDPNQNQDRKYKCKYNVNKPVGRRAKRFPDTVKPNLYEYRLSYWYNLVILFSGF